MPSALDGPTKGLKSQAYREKNPIPDMVGLKTEG